MIFIAALLSGCAHTDVQVNSRSNASSAQVQASGKAAFLVLGIAAAVSESAAPPPPELAPDRRIVEQDCSRPIEDLSANLKCR